MIAKAAGIGVNPIHLVARVFYNLLASMTGIVGLTPLQFLLGVVGLVLVIIVGQLVLVASGKQGWHLNDVRADAELAAQLRKDLDGGG